MSEPARKITGIGRYKVGTVARLTGLSPHLIRAWERRYGAVQPQRTRAGTRLYSDEHVARLQLMKALVDLGEPIGQVAALSSGELQERLSQRSPRAEPHGEPAAGPPRLALFCPRLSAQIDVNPTAFGGIERVADETDFERYLEAISACDPDVLVMALDALDALDADPIACIERCQAGAPDATLFVVHAIASAHLLASLGERGVRLARAPLRVSLLRRMVLDSRDIRGAFRVRERVDAFPGPTALLADRPAPRLSDRQLAELLEVRTSVSCECPSQLAHLVQQLLDFERYSESCIVEHPRDADLHRALASGTGNARSLMEELLLRVCEHDGIPVETRHEP